jgi:hypothetical protein
MSWEDAWYNVISGTTLNRRKKGLENVEKEAFRSAYLAMATALGFFEFANMDTDGMSDEQKEKMEQAELTIQRHAFAAACGISAYITGLTVDVTTLSFTPPGAEEPITISSCGALILPDFEYMKETNAERYQLYSELLGVTLANSNFQDSEWANLAAFDHQLFEG